MQQTKNLRTLLTRRYRAAINGKHTEHLEMETSAATDGSKIQALYSALLFTSASGFAGLFTPREDLNEVVIEFMDAKVMDHSDIEAIDASADRYQKLGKRLHPRHNCAEVLHKARRMIEVNVLEDPVYHLADDQLG